MDRSFGGMCAFSNEAPAMFCLAFGAWGTAFGEVLGFLPRKKSPSRCFFFFEGLFEIMCFFCFFFGFLSKFLGTVLQTMDLSWSF